MHCQIANKASYCFEQRYRKRLISLAAVLFQPHRHTYAFAKKRPKPSEILMRMNELSAHGIRPVIGLEVHVQLDCASKLFSVSSARDSSEAPTNTRVSLFDMAAPGTLPRLNKKAVELSLLACVLLHCDVPESCRFDRKHYFYPDLPLGYQITQKQHPIANSGYFDFYSCEMEEYNEFLNATKECKKRLNIERIQLEMDSGRVVRHGDRELVDLNRAGCALVEVVTAPGLATPSEVVCFVEQLRLLLAHNAVTEGEMNKGQFRVDANVSLVMNGIAGECTELKNISHLRHLFNSISLEISRQARILLDGGRVEKETRQLDDFCASTSSRGKGDAFHDYRFFPETNLPRLRIQPEWLALAKSRVLPSDSLPHENLIKHYGFTPSFALHVVRDEKLYNFVRQCIVYEDLQIGYAELSVWLPEIAFIGEKVKGLGYPPSRDLPRWFVRCFCELIALVSQRLLTKAICLDLIKAYAVEAISTAHQHSSTPLINVKEKIDSCSLWRVSDSKDVEKVANAVFTDPKYSQLVHLYSIENEQSLNRQLSRQQIRSRRSLLFSACIEAGNKRVTIEDFERAFNAMISASKEDKFSRMR